MNIRYRNPHSFTGYKIFDYYWEDDDTAWFDTTYTTAAGDVWYRINFTRYAEHSRNHELTKMPKGVIIIHVEQIVGEFAVASDDTYQMSTPEVLKSLDTITDIIHQYVLHTDTTVLILPIISDRPLKRARLLNHVKSALVEELGWKHTYNHPSIQVLATSERKMFKSIRDFYRAII